MKDRENAERESIVVHYHLFKNAGTSVDQILKKNFGDSWYGFDGDSAGDIITTSQLEKTISDNPQKIAFSSHQIVPPLPEADAAVYPIVFLRDPIDRVKSGYLFEWKKQLGLDFPKGSLREFVQEKFRYIRKSSVEEFQTLRLSNDHKSNFDAKTRSDEEMLEGACEFIASLPFVGVVDEFSGSMELLSTYLGEVFPEFRVSDVKANVLQDVSTPVATKREKIREELGDELYEMIVNRNALDEQLYSFAKNHFQMLLGQYGIEKNVSGTAGG